MPRMVQVPDWLRPYSRYEFSIEEVEKAELDKMLAKWRAQYEALNPQPKKAKAKTMKYNIVDNRPKAATATRNVGDLHTGTFFYGKIKGVFGLWYKLYNGYTSISEPINQSSSSHGVTVEDYQPVNVEVRVLGNLVL